MNIDYILGMLTGAILVLLGFVISDIIRLLARRKNDKTRKTNP